LKALHIYAGNLFGGLENLLVSMAALRGLCPQLEPHFALCFEGRLSKELRAAGATVHLMGDVRFSRPWTVWKARRRLCCILEEINPDAVICHECWPHVLAAPEVRRHDSALVFWMHGWVLGGWLERLAKKHPPDRAITTSHYSASMLPRLFPGVTSDVIHPIVAAPQIDRDAARRRTREEFQTPLDSVVIAATCRIVRYKGHDLLLKALGRLRDTPGWVLWVAGAPQRTGEKAYLAQLRAKAGELGILERIRFLGERPDIPEILAGVDIHCQPNTGAEPFGIAFVEALYAGVPVVTTGIGGALEIVDETCGRLVNLNDPDALANTLKELISDDVMRRRLSAGGPARARTLCDPAVNLARLQEALAAAAGSRA